MKFIHDKLLYKNAMSSEDDVRHFIMEGQGIVTFPNKKMQLQEALDPSEGQKANIVYWCNEDFPDNIEISWNFCPIKEPGLAMLFFAAKGRQGEDIFDSGLAKRTGDYEMYYGGDINALHVSYFRRNSADERAFHTCNLRKSFGFHLVAQGGDPIPDTADALSSYRIKVVKFDNAVWFYIDDLLIFEWFDDGISYGDVLKGGKIGFRQMSPLIATYSDLTVYSIKQK